MATVARSPVTYDSRFGITKRHFGVFQDVAAFGGWILMVRGGKPAAIPWINRGLPAKPIFLKAKVDPALGLLRLPRDASREPAHHHLCYVVESAPAPGAPTLAATNPLHPHRKTLAVDLGRWPWSEPLLRHHRDDLVGLVLDESGLPFTSDYDLGAVIPVGGPLSAATTGAAGSHQYDYQKNITSALVQHVATELNRRMLLPGGNVRTSVRVVHGASAQYKNSPADKAGESILVFYPSGQVECFAAPSVEEAGAVMKAIWSEHAAPG
jgi:hypothetical protein